MDLKVADLDFVFNDMIAQSRVASGYTPTLPKCSLAHIYTVV